MHEGLNGESKGLIVGGQSATRILYGDRDLKTTPEKSTIEDVTSFEKFGGQN